MVNIYLLSLWVIFVVDVQYAESVIDKNNLPYDIFARDAYLSKYLMENQISVPLM